MKKLLRRMLLLTLALCVLCGAAGQMAKAEAPAATEAPELTDEQLAERIFHQLVYIYEAELKYVRELQRAWSIYLKSYTPGVTGIGEEWYADNFLMTDLDHSMDFWIYFAFQYNVSWEPADDFSALSYRFVVQPLISYYQQDVRQAVLMVAFMVYGNPHLPDYLETVKADIRTLMAKAPEYPGLAQLQDFYRKTFLMVDWVENMNTDFNGLTAQLGVFENEMRLLKSDFVFLFDWFGGTSPDWDITIETSPVFQQLFDAAQGR